MTHLPWVCADPRDDRSNLSRPFRMIVILFERLMSTGSRSDIPFLLAGARMIGQMFDDLPSCFIQSQVCGERGSAKIAYTKLVHQKYLPRSSAKVSGISLQSVLLLAHHSTNCPRTALGSTKVTRLPRR